MSVVIAEQSTITAAPGLITEFIDEDETIIQHPTDNVYYGLNNVGSRIWSLIQTPTTVKHVNEILLLEYDVQHDQCLAELLDLLRDLVARGLVDRIDGEAE